VAKEVTEVCLVYSFLTQHSKKWPSKSLHTKHVLSMDLPPIMAGSGILGQFEERFKALLRDIEDKVRSPL
jgi:ATP-dependent Clp protease ATP-binding subunit ClpA